MKIRIRHKVSQNILTRFIFILLILSFYYSFYRYPFQINSETTSLNYKNTPMLLQALKYLIYFIILYIFIIYSALKNKQFKIYKKRIFILLLSAILFVVPMFYGIISKNFNVLQTGIFFPINILVLSFNLDKLNIEKISNQIYIFAKICVIVEIIQLMLFFIIGRLPALAWGNNLIEARFGSIWDDPNGFGIFISFLIPFLIVRTKGLKKIIWVFSMLVMLVLTQSLTGIIAFFISYILIFIMLFLKLRTKKALKDLMIMLFSILSIIFVVELFIIPSNIFQNYIISKQGSIMGHTNSITQLLNANMSSYLGFNPYGRYGESGYINIMLNYGILYLLLYIFANIYSIFSLLNKIKIYRTYIGSELYYGALFFQIAYLLGMINLPLEEIFPINIIYVICFIFGEVNPNNDIINAKRKNKKIKLVWGGRRVKVTWGNKKLIG